ncbi:MAG: branched-chain amino acid ABC transporter permease, partial [Spirochaetaceae bacterium]|nr:branched-chain amino acid ABC transporter permease [Spirochaetaceae bacterium]
MILNKNQNAALSIIAMIVLLGFVFLANTFFQAFYLRIFNLCGIYIILALSLNLVNGFTGLFSLGHSGFMAIGA